MALKGHLLSGGLVGSLAALEGGTEGQTPAMGASGPIWVGPGAYLLVTGGQEIQGGFTIAEVDLGTPANGATLVVDPSDGQKQKITNNVAGFTISATEEVGDVELRIINGASAGTITFSGFNIQYPGGATLDTVNGNEFVVYIFGFGAAGADYILQARQ